ncbi:MAG: platelet-activating factor acetylhydrolase IB subunit [Thermoguttaceae bacterium]
MTFGRLWVWVLTAAIAVLTISAVAKAEPVGINSPSEPVPREGRWLMRFNEINARVKQGNADLVFIGDSITQGWEGRGARDIWNKFYAKRNAVNLGIGGDQTQHVLWRLENGNIDHISPKLAVLMVGTNNAGLNKPDDIANGIKAIVRELRTRLPRTQILLMGVLPRGVDNSDLKRWSTVQTNRIISALADGKNVFYMDIGAKFVNRDDSISTDLMPDLLHLSPKGYQVWAEAIEPLVAKLLGEKRAVGKQPMR